MQFDFGDVLPSLRGRIFSKVESENASVSQTINIGHTEAYGEKLMGSATGTLNGRVRTNVVFSLHVVLVWLVITFCIRVSRKAILDQQIKYLVGSKSFRPDIQKPRQIENAVRDI